MQEQSHGIQKFARAKGFTTTLGVIGFGIATFGFFLNDSLSSRVTKVETKTKIVNPCSINKDDSVTNKKLCRQGLIVLLKQTSNDPDKAIQALGLEDK